MLLTNNSGELTGIIERQRETILKQELLISNLKKQNKELTIKMGLASIHLETSLSAVQEIKEIIGFKKESK